VVVMTEALAQRAAPYGDDGYPAGWDWRRYLLPGWLVSIRRSVRIWC
jgi:hypothetical protein